MFARFPRPGLGPLGPRCRSAGDRAAPVACQQLSRRAAGRRVATDLAASPSLKRLPANSRRGAAGGRSFYRDGGVIGWALRWVLLCCGIVLLCVGIVKTRSAVAPGPRRRNPNRPHARRWNRSARSNTIVYTANEQGHVILDAAVNGAPVRMLVDTGASLVTLTPADARAAGIAPGELVFNGPRQHRQRPRAHGAGDASRNPHRPAVDLRCARRRARASQRLAARHELSSAGCKATKCATASSRSAGSRRAPEPAQ